MKNFIKSLMLFTILLFISCSVEKEELSSHEKRDVIIEKTYKSLEVSHTGTIETADVEWLKSELNVQQTVLLTKNKSVWLMYNNQTIADINELLLFTDEIFEVKEIHTTDLETYLSRDGDTVGDGDTDSDVERDGDTVGDGDTDSDVERDDDTDIGE
jgi:hypothetical protein